MPWEDSLDDFERQLAADKLKDAVSAEPKADHRRDRSHGHSSHRSHRHDRNREGDETGEDRHRHKRRRRSHDGEEGDEERSSHRHRHRHHRERDESASRSHAPRHNGEERELEDRQEQGQELKDDVAAGATPPGSPPAPALKRDAWMEAPAAGGFEYRHTGGTTTQNPVQQGTARARLDSKIHDAELDKHHLQDQEREADGKAIEDDNSQSVSNTRDYDYEAEGGKVDYEFGDSGSRWRMTRLRNVYRQAEETGETVEDVALKQYGSLRAFDEAREEEIETDRRERVGPGYVGKIKPSGELHEERRLAETKRSRELGASRGNRNGSSGDQGDDGQAALEARQGNPGIGSTMHEAEPPARTYVLDSTALNRLRAQMMKAKLKGLPDAERLEREYNEASLASSAGPEAGVVVLSTMENRMLAGGRQGEVKDVGNRRGRERGNVEENTEMSLDDMVREERRTKGLFGNEGERLAERIAKDGKFTNDLDYMDENANKLAKRVHKSDAALRNSAIANHRLTNSIHASCPLCHHEDRPGNDGLPMCPVVSMGHRSYLTLATEPDISPHGSAVIVPVAHHANLLHCDDDEWEEIRNFQKSLVRMFHARDLGVLFYENGAHPRQQRHAALVAVGVPLGLADDAPAFFREAILASDDEWTQHRKLIATTGKGRNGFRRALAKEMPYFHVWTEIDGGVGHVVEDERRWPKGDLFAREVIGGMLRVKPDIVRKQGRWEKGAETERRVKLFRKGWSGFDWTRVLIEGGDG